MAKKIRPEEIGYEVAQSRTVMDFAFGRFDNGAGHQAGHLRPPRRNWISPKLIHPLREEPDFGRFPVFIDAEIISGEAIAISMPNHHFHGHERDEFFRG